MLDNCLVTQKVQKGSSEVGDPMWENWELQPGVNHLLRMRVHVAHQTIGSEPGHFKLLVSNERSQYTSTVCLGTSVYIDAAYCKD